MKLYKIVPVIAALATAVNAKALFAFFPDGVMIGESYTVEWLADASESLELLLVHKKSYGWDSVKTLFKNVVGHWPNDNYTWVLNDSYPTGNDYGLWLSSSPVNSEIGGYADLTQWFDIVPAEKKELKV